MKKVLLALGLIIILTGGFFLARPLFVNDEVNEDSPLTDNILSNFSGDTPLVQLPDAEEIESMTEDAKMAVERSIVDKMAKMDPVIVEDEMAAMEVQPKLLSSGSFRDADNFHKGSGDALIYSLPDSSQLLRLENFDVTNGPDLFVYLVKDANNVKGDFVNLGKLKGNKGNQNYTIPSEVNIDDYQAVVVWCRAFSVLFSTADLK
jgi:hypothetical protein